MPNIWGKGVFGTKSLGHAHGVFRGFHWAWVILIVSFVNLFINYSIRLGYGVVLPEMIGTLGLTRRQAGDILNAYLIAYVSCSPFTGYLTDRFGARRVISLFGILSNLRVSPDPKRAFRKHLEMERYLR
jgi:sugar phosphate permease